MNNWNLGCIHWQYDLVEAHSFIHLVIPLQCGLLLSSFTFCHCYCIYCLESFPSEHESMFQTNSNRKRHKLDAEESDDNGYGKGKLAKEAEGKNFELQKEEFPKGKRKARKRRRLALQGRAVKDVRRRQKTDSLTDEDVGGPFSNSSEESMFSEDEIQVGRICPTGSTSDDAGSA